MLFILITAALTLAACNVGAEPSPTTDLNAISTAALATAVAQVSGQQTQTALAAPSATSPATNTPISLATLPTTGAASPAANTGALPTVSFNTTPGTAPLAGFTPIGSPIAPAATKSLGDDCSNSVFEGDITIPDGSVLEPGTNFVKVWKIRNTGTCAWDEGYTLVYIGGSTPNLDPYDFNFSTKNPQDFVESGEAIDMSLKLTTPCTPGKYEGHWRMRNDKGYYFGTLVSVYVEVKEKCSKK